MGRRKDELKLELLKWQGDANFWRGVALALAGIILALLLYIWS